MQVYGQPYTDPANPFLTNYVNGSCQYPQLTIGGYLDAYQHGRDLHALYSTKLGLIPATLDEGGDGRVWFRSTSSPLTQGSAGGVLRGLWPGYKGPLPLHQQVEAVDTINRGFACPARDRILEVVQSGPEWEEHLAVTDGLRRDLAGMFGAEEQDEWLETWDHFADNFQGRLCNGYELPCSLEEEGNCVSREQADEVFRAGDWMYNYWWRRNQNVTEYIRVIEGMFIAELVRSFEAVVAGEEEVVYRHVFAHDGDIAPLLGALGIKALRWPGMGSNVAFEFWYFSLATLSNRLVLTVVGKRPSQRCMPGCCTVDARWRQSMAPWSGFQCPGWLIS